MTIDDCTHVIDSGRVKEMRYEPSTRMSCLVEVWISKVQHETAALAFYASNLILVPPKDPRSCGPVVN